MNLEFKLIALSLTAILPVINPVGTAVILFGMTTPLSLRGRKVLARKIAIYSFLLLMIFYLGGRLLLDFFGVSMPIVQISGGSVLALMGWKLLNENPVSNNGSDNQAKDLSSHEAYLSEAFYPYTFPITIGPGCLAVATTLGAHIRHENLMQVSIDEICGSLGLLGACMITYFCLAYIQVITQRLGPAALQAIAKILAFFVICIGAQIVWSGIQTLGVK